MQFVHLVIAVQLSEVARLQSPAFCRSADEKRISKSEFEERNIIVLAFDSQDCQKACLGVGTCQFEDYGLLSDSDREYLLNAAVISYCSQRRPRCDEELLETRSGIYLTPNENHKKQTKYTHPTLTTVNCCVSGYSRLRGDPLPVCGASEAGARRLCTCRNGTTTLDNASSTTLSETSTAVADVSTTSATTTASGTKNLKKTVVIVAVTLTVFLVTLIAVCAFLLWKRRTKHRKSQIKSVAYLDVSPPTKGEASSGQSSGTRKGFPSSDSRTRRDKTSMTKTKNSSSRRKFLKSKTGRIVYSRNPISSTDSVYEVVN